MKVDRTRLQILDLHRQSDDRFWRAQAPVERLRAVQVNREVAHGRPRLSQRLQRVLEIAEQRRG